MLSYFIVFFQMYKINFDATFLGFYRYTLRAYISIKQRAKLVSILRDLYDLIKSNLSLVLAIFLRNISQNMKRYRIIKCANMQKLWNWYFYLKYTFRKVFNYPI